MSILILAFLLAAAPEGPPSSVEGMEPAPGVPSLLQSGVPALPPDLRSRTGQYLNARAASLADVSDDGGALLITTRFASTAQLHVVEMPLGMRTQVTFGDEPVNEAKFQPGDPQTVWYLQDSGGGEFYQLFRLDRRSGRSELLTDGKSRHQSLTLSRDGRRIAFSGTERNGKDTDVYVADTSSPKNARRVTEAEGTWSPVEFSRDGARLLIVRERSIQDADLFALEVSSGKLTQLTFVDAQLVRYPAGGGAGTIPAFLYKPRGATSKLRVPRSEAEQIVKAVRSRGKDVWYLLGLNEGHGFAKKENRDYAIAAIALFFQQKLLEPIKTN